MHLRDVEVEWDGSLPRNGKGLAKIIQVEEHEVRVLGRAWQLVGLSGGRPQRPGRQNMAQRKTRARQNLRDRLWNDFWGPSKDRFSLFDRTFLADKFHLTE